MSPWYLLAVDPGIRGCGAAIFTPDAKLFAAAYVKSPERRGNRSHEAVQMARAVMDWHESYRSGLKVPSAELAVEWPQVYASRIRAGATDTDPNDLLALCAVDTAIAALFDRPVTSYFPAEWKGQLTKDACHERIRTRLDISERAVMDGITGALAHNAYDAIGIGLHHLGRFARRRVIPS